MSRKRRKEKQHRKKPNPQKEAAQVPSKKLSGWSVFLSVIAVAGFLIAVYTLSPRITLHPGVPLKPSDPFGTPFICSNDGSLSVMDVQFSCSMSFKDANQNTFVNDTESGLYSAPYLGPGQETTVGCNFPSNRFRSFSTDASILSANATLYVSFRGSFIPWRTERNFKFQATKDMSGEFHWIPVATVK